MTTVQHWFSMTTSQQKSASITIYYQLKPTTFLLRFRPTTAHHKPIMIFFKAPAASYHVNRCILRQTPVDDQWRRVIGPGCIKSP